MVKGGAWQSAAHGEGRRMAKGGTWRRATCGKMQHMAKGQTGGRSSQQKEREKEEKRTGMRLVFMSGRRARQACVKNGGQPAPTFASERGSQIPAERREKVSRKGGKKEREKKNEPKTPQALGREEGASEREAREKTHPKAWCERDGAPQKKGEAGEG